MSLMGPLGMARWVTAACQEIVRRNDDLCLLVDRKIAKTERVVQDLRHAADEAIASIERLALLKGDLKARMEEANRERKRLNAAKDSSTHQATTFQSTARGRVVVPETPQRMTKIIPPVSSRFGFRRCDQGSPIARRNTSSFESQSSVSSRASSPDRSKFTRQSSRSGKLTPPRVPVDFLVAKDVLTPIVNEERAKSDETLALSDQAIIASDKRKKANASALDEDIDDEDELIPKRHKMD